MCVRAVCTTQERVVAESIESEPSRAGRRSWAAGAVQAGYYWWGRHGLTLSRGCAGCRRIASDEQAGLELLLRVSTYLLTHSSPDKVPPVSHSL